MKIHDYIIKNLKDDKKNDILDTINESINETDETVLPGLGVLFKILWHKSSDNEKDVIAQKIVDGIKEETK